MITKASKRKAIFTFKCCFCDEQLDSNDTFVVTAEYKHFCIIINPGHPPIKDCWSDYRNKIKQNQIVRIQQHIDQEIKNKEEAIIQKEKRLKEIPIMEKNLQSLKQYLKDKKNEKRLS